MKATKRESTIWRLFIDNPGYIECELGGKGEQVHAWKGGIIARIEDHLVAPVVWLENVGALPWALEWIEHDELGKCWYIRRKDKEDD